MMNDQQIFAGAVGVRQIMVAVSRLACARRIGTLHFPRFDRRLQMRLQHRHLGVEGGFDLGELDLSLRLDLEMDRVVLSFLLLQLRLVRCEGGVDLRPRLDGE
jgi:hypothetical protein